MAATGRAGCGHQGSRQRPIRTHMESAGAPLRSYRPVSNERGFIPKHKDCALFQQRRKLSALAPSERWRGVDHQTAPRTDWTGRSRSQRRFKIGGPYARSASYDERMLKAMLTDVQLWV